MENGSILRYENGRRVEERNRENTGAKGDQALFDSDGRRQNRKVSAAMFPFAFALSNLLGQA
jgi:hypothetical protein